MIIIYLFVLYCAVWYCVVTFALINKLRHFRNSIEVQIALCCKILNFYMYLTQNIKSKHRSSRNKWYRKSAI